MKTVILAGGFGTRISEESHLKPKPMIEIGGRPILWHIMKTYSYFGYNDFIICLGYKGYHIKEYFEHYFLHESDVTFNFGMQSERVIHQHSAEPWSVTLVNTGIDTMTGGRVKKIQKYIGDNAFMLTYGDGVADVNIKDLVSFHQSNGKLATVTAIQPSGRFGSLRLSPSNQVLGFEEKPKGDGAWINGGFFVLEPGVFEYLDDDKSVFEESPLENLALNGELAAFKHQKFWQPMDSMRDKNKLNEMWDAGKAPWKVW